MDGVVGIEDDGLGIAEVAGRLGVSTHTLRYYERAGLMGAVGRATNGRRVYSAADLRWIEFLLKLRAVGMGISDMRAFAELRAQGPETVARRLAILRDLQVTIDRRQRELAEHAAAMAEKVATYEAMLTGPPTSGAQASIDDMSP